MRNRHRRRSRRLVPIAAWCNRCAKSIPAPKAAAWVPPAGPWWGGLLGNQIGGGSGRQLATIAGAIGGAVTGNQIEGNVNTSRSYDIAVRLDNGTTRTIRQSAQPHWSAGDQVRIIDGQIRSN